VSEGKGPDCRQQATEESKPAQATKAAQDTVPAKPAKSKHAGSRRVPSFLRRVDLLFQGRQ
jgi:hypothetical protein